MIDFIKMNRHLSIALSLTILFFLRKGIQYAIVGGYIPLLIIIGLVILIGASLQLGNATFRIVLRVWAILLVMWSVARIIISAIHLTVRPFDDSWHMTHQSGFYALVLSFIMLVLGVYIFRNSNRKRMKSKSVN